MMCISLIVPQFINEIAASEVAIVYANESKLDTNLNQSQNQTPQNNTNNSETPDDADKDKTKLDGTVGDTPKPDGEVGDTTKPDGTPEDTPNPDDLPDDETDLDSTENLDLNPDDLLGDETDLEAIDDVTYAKRFLGKMKGLGMMSYSDEAAAGAPTSAPHGSGSYQLNAVENDYRFYTEYFVKADTKKALSRQG